MNPVDFKKTEKELYQPRTTPSIIDVPEMTFIMVDGRGDPNTGAEYKAALEVLYGLSYGVKMSKMGGERADVRCPGVCGELFNNYSGIEIRLVTR
jgi:hypothetical protein